MLKRQKEEWTEQGDELRDQAPKKKKKSLKACWKEGEGNTIEA